MIVWDSKASLLVMSCFRCFSSPIPVTVQQMSAEQDEDGVSERGVRNDPLYARYEIHVILLVVCIHMSSLDTYWHTVLSTYTPTASIHPSIYPVSVHSIH